MTVLVFGAGGQIGQELLRSLSGRVVCAVTRSGRLPNGVGVCRRILVSPETLRALAYGAAASAGGECGCLYGG